jgi:Uma2 family endonuclease
MIDGSATIGLPPDAMAYRLVTHRDLPDSDGLPVDNFYQPVQAELLTSSVRPYLDQRHADGRYLIGTNSGIYWKQTNPPLDGCKAPDWFFVPDVSPQTDSVVRRSYVVWNEGVAPLVVMEFVSGDGKEEHDDTPGTGKLWVYRRGIRAPYYVIHDPLAELLEVYRLEGTEYRLLEPDPRGHFAIPELGLAVGHWKGRIQQTDSTWVRFFTLQGDLLPSADERAALFQRIVTEERVRADHNAKQLAELMQKLQDNGIDPRQLPAKGDGP